MFGFFSSQNSKMRSTARNWVETAQTVWNYRRDVLSEADRKELRVRTEELRAKLKVKADAADLKLSIESLEPVLARTGGKIYPKTSLIDNVEFILIVAIVILGIRSFIAQPFKIPTNSMWPSYYGMTAENLLARHEEPNPVTQVARLLAFGAIRHEVLAPDNGEVSAMFFRNEPHTMAYKVVKGRKWLVFPTDLKEYTFYVNGKEATVRVPVDFSETEFDELVHDTFFGGNEGFLKAIAAAEAAHTLERGRLQHKGATYSVDLFRFGKTVKQGEPLMRFDILSGDMLFVDRISYHFVKPSVGDGFVFHTRKIELLDNADQYYIKRLVGLPGDTIEIREPVVYRNGAPITGAKAFELNAHRVSPYRGYADASRWGWPNLRKGEPLKVPDNHFFALGDNSYNSLDGRYWGFIPAKEAIGRPLFIFYPLTKRWGRSH